MIKEIQTDLLLLQDLKYKDFHSKLMPTIDKEKIIGVRTPVLRKYAKEITGSEKEQAVLSVLPHTYYEESNLHALLIQKIKDFDECIRELDRFLPFVDNWATCDMMSPKGLKKNPEKLLLKIKEWLTSEHTYTVRFAVKCLMDFYLDENFTDEVLELAADVQHDDYYVKMVCAWFFVTALAKQYEKSLPYLTEKRLDTRVHNKTIQKAVESYRIDDDTKEYLKKLKIKTVSRPLKKD